MTLQLTLTSPKDENQRQETIMVELPAGIDRNYFTIRLNGIVPKKQPHNIPDEAWRVMRQIHEELDLQPGDIIWVESIS